MNADARYLVSVSNENGEISLCFLCVISQASGTWRSFWFSRRRGTDLISSSMWRNGMEASVRVAFKRQNCSTYGLALPSTAFRMLYDTGSPSAILSLFCIIFVTALSTLGFVISLFSFPPFPRPSIMVVDFTGDFHDRDSVSRISNSPAIGWPPPLGACLILFEFCRFWKFIRWPHVQKYASRSETHLFHKYLRPTTATTGFYQDRKYLRRETSIYESNSSPSSFCRLLILLIPNSLHREQISESCFQLLSCDLSARPTPKVISVDQTNNLFLKNRDRQRHSHPDPIGRRLAPAWPTDGLQRRRQHHSVLQSGRITWCTVRMVA